MGTSPSSVFEATHEPALHAEDVAQVAIPEFQVQRDLPQSFDLQTCRLLRT